LALDEERTRGGKRKRRERLRAMRAQTAAEAAGRQLTEEEYEQGGHFVASISPMAPQRTREEDSRRRGR